MELGGKSEDVRVEDLGYRIRIEDLKACHDSSSLQTKIHFSYTILSKRMPAWFVDNMHVPCSFTLAST
jgi:hypothetical protein